MQTTVSHRKMAPSTTKSNRKIFYGSGNTIFYSISLSVFVFSILINLVSSIDHCSKHRYKNSINSTHMQFTKEVVSQEYTTLGQFKSLHCCAKGYRSIEWYKDDKPYPWNIEDSSFILYPEAANQTIYSRSVATADTGVYKCVLQNETHKTEHEVELKLQETSIDRPLATFRPRDQYVNLGETARFYCEAFIGNLGIPDAKKTLRWYQVFDDNIEQEVKDGNEEMITRQDGQIVGLYLSIPSIQPHHYGHYVCRIEMGNSDHRLDMSTWLIGSPLKLDTRSLISPILLALSTFILVIGLLIVIKVVQQRYKEQNQCIIVEKSNDEEIGMRGY